MKYFIFYIFIFILFSHNIFAGGLMATGDWNETIDENDLLSGAGSDITDTYESAVNATRLMSINMRNKTWEMTIEMSETNWHGDFSIYARRTDNSGSVTGGQTYQEITTSTEYFFEGSGNQLNLLIQYQLRGVTLQIPADIYTITIIYTITET